MRYYSYISHAKIDMLFPQVPNALQQKMAAKIGFDMKLLSGSLETQRDTFSSREARLLAIEEHLLALGEVGSGADHTSWISGNLEAKFLDIGDDVVLYVSKFNGVFVALGGSAHHLIGSTKPEAVAISASHLYRLTGQLKRLVERDPKKLLLLPESALQHFIAAGVGQEFTAWMDVIQQAWNNSEELSQSIQFLAKRLVTQKRFGDTFTLATPLYVALRKN